MSDDTDLGPLRDAYRKFRAATAFARDEAVGRDAELRAHGRKVAFARLPQFRTTLDFSNLEKFIALHTGPALSAEQQARWNFLIAALSGTNQRNAAFDVAFAEAAIELWSKVTAEPNMIEPLRVVEGPVAH